ncbi:tyrosyl-tRNA synthetase [Lipomyces oligophaga]|uniref:tyrosyl-tRNA synthetase n=1 Tax=Lipomyces oligophaga TaxID=45792 RepID=UPI0034CD6A8F
MRFLLLYSNTFRPRISGRVRFASTNARRWVNEVEHQASLIDGPLLDNLVERGLLKDCSNAESLAKDLEAGKILTMYSGADPTAQSLHIGNLLPLITMLHFGIRGHRMIGLIGGATVMLGDPSGRTTERAKMQEEARLKNEAKITRQMKSIFDNGIAYANSKGYSCEPITMVNNKTWWAPMTFLGFMYNLGPMFRVNEMMRRESVQERMKNEHGIGFNEFTYQILQAYDFYHLFQHENCVLQIGGSDQYGNITTGIDLIRKIVEKPTESDSSLSYGLTTPLLTSKSGAKLGKSAGNSVWLDPEMTSPFSLYQYLLNTADADVETYLNALTLLTNSEINAILQRHQVAPELRLAQSALAFELCELVHGPGTGVRAETQTRILYSKGSVSDPAKEIIAAFKGSDIYKSIPRAMFESTEMLDLVAQIDTRTRKELRSAIIAGAVRIGRDRIECQNPRQLLDSSLLLDDQLLLIRIGKSTTYVVELSDS